MKGNENMTKKIPTRQNPLKTSLEPNTLEQYLSKPVGNHPTMTTVVDKSNNVKYHRSTIYKDANTSGDLDPITGLYNLDPKVDVEGGIWYIDHLNQDIPSIDRGIEKNKSGQLEFHKKYNDDSNTYSAYAVQIGDSKYDDTYDLLHTFFKKQSRFYLAISSDEFTKCTGAAILCPISSNYTFRKQSHIDAIRDPNTPNSVVNTTFGKDVRTKKDFDSSFHTETDFNFFIETLVQGLAIDISGTDQDYNAKMKRYIAMKDAFSKQLYSPLPTIKDQKQSERAEKLQKDGQKKFISMLGIPSSEISGIFAQLKECPPLKITCYIDIRYHSNTRQRPTSMYSQFSNQKLSTQADPVEYVIAHGFVLDAELDQTSTTNIRYIIDHSLLTSQSFRVVLRNNEYEEICYSEGKPMMIDLEFDFLNPNQDIILDEINTVQTPIRVTKLAWQHPTKPGVSISTRPFDSELIISPTNPKKYSYIPNNVTPSKARYGGTHSGLISSRYTPAEKNKNKDFVKPEVRTSYITTEIFSLPTHYFFAMNDFVHSRKISNFQNKPLAHWQQFVIDSLLPKDIKSTQNKYKAQLDSLKMHPNQVSATFPQNMQIPKQSAKYTNNIKFKIRKVQELVYSILANEITDIFKAWLGLGKGSNFNLSSLIDLLEGDSQSVNRRKEDLTKTRTLDNKSWNTQNSIQIDSAQNTIQINTFPNVKIDNASNDSIGCFFYPCGIFNDVTQIYELDGLSMYVLALYMQAINDTTFFQTNRPNRSYNSFLVFEEELEKIFSNGNKKLSLSSFRKDFLVPVFSKLCMDLLLQYFLQELAVGNSGVSSVISQYFQGSKVPAFLSNVQNRNKLNQYVWKHSLNVFISTYQDPSRQSKDSYLLQTPISPVPKGMDTNVFEYKAAYRYQEIKTFFLFSYASLSSKTHIDVSNYDDAIVYMHHAITTPATNQMWQDAEKILNAILDFDVFKKDVDSGDLGAITNPLKTGETEDDVKIIQGLWKEIKRDAPIVNLEYLGVYSFFGTGKYVVPDLKTDIINLSGRKSTRYKVDLPNLPKGVNSGIVTVNNTTVKDSKSPVEIGKRLYVFIGDPEYAKITNQYYFAPIVTESELSLDLTQQEPPQPPNTNPLVNGRNYQYALKVYQSGQNTLSINSNNFTDAKFETHLKEVLLLTEDFYIDFSRMFTTVGESSIDVDGVGSNTSIQLLATQFTGTLQPKVDLASPIGGKTTYLHKDQITQLNVDRFQVLGKSIIKQIFRPTYYACNITEPIRDTSINLIELFCKIYATPIEIADGLILGDEFSTKLMSNFKDVLSLDLLSISLSKNPSKSGQEYFVSKNLCSNAIFAFCDFLIDLENLSKKGKLDFFEKKDIENEELWYNDEGNVEMISNALLALENSLNDLRAKKIENLPKVDVPIAKISSRFEALITFLSAFEECQDPLKKLILGMYAINPSHVQNTTLTLSSKFELIDSMQWLFLASGVESIDDLEDVAMFAGGNLVNDVAHHAKNSKDYTATTKVKPPKLQPIGTKAPNIFGLYDMSGNAKELVKVSEGKKEYLGTFGGSYLDEPDDLRLLNLKVGNMDSWFAKDMTNQNKILLKDDRANDYKAVDVGFRFYIRYTVRKPKRAGYSS